MQLPTYILKQCALPSACSLHLVQTVREVDIVHTLSSSGKMGPMYLFIKSKLMCAQHNSPMYPQHYEYMYAQLVPQASEFPEIFHSQRFGPIFATKDFPRFCA